MRIVIVGELRTTGAGAQARMLAERLGVPYLTDQIAGGVERALGAHTSGFVLDGFPRTPAEASALDAFLRSRAAELDVVLHRRLPDAVLTPADEALLAHYRGRVVELDAAGGATEVIERALEALREALVAA